MPRLDTGKLPVGLKIEISRAVESYGKGLSYDGTHLSAPDDAILEEFCGQIGLKFQNEPAAQESRETARSRTITSESYQSYVKIYSEHFDGTPFLREDSFSGFEEAGHSHYRAARRRVEEFGNDKRKADGTLRHFEIAIELSRDPQIKKDFRKFLLETPERKNLGYTQFCVTDPDSPEKPGCGTPIKAEAENCWNCGEKFDGFIGHDPYVEKKSEESWPGFGSAGSSEPRSERREQREPKVEDVYEPPVRQRPRETPPTPEREEISQQHAPDAQQSPQQYPPPYAQQYPPNYSQQQPRYSPNTGWKPWVGMLLGGVGIGIGGAVVASAIAPGVAISQMSNGDGAAALNTLTTFPLLGCGVGGFFGAIGGHLIGRWSFLEDLRRAGCTFENYSWNLRSEFEKGQREATERRRGRR